LRKLAFVFVVASLLVALAVPAMAGPFSDVPANSWAYKAVQDLAAKGLVIGYGDSTFRGDRLATRYEMAMVVARMLDMYEKGQNAQDQKIQMNANDIATLMKLAEEFKSELASLNVRVAALEKKAALDTVNFTGDARFRIGSEKKTYYGLSGSELFSDNGNNNNIPYVYIIASPYVVQSGLQYYDFSSGSTLTTTGNSFGGIIGKANMIFSTGAAPQDQKNNTFMRYRIRLNVAAPVADNISFNARLTMEKNAGVNGNGDNSNWITASTTGYNDDSNTLYIERSYITWTLNPYPVTFVLGRLPTMDTGAYYNNLFMDTGTEGAMAIFDLSNMLPSTSISAAWVKLFDGGLVTSADQSNGLNDKDAYIFNIKTRPFNAFNLEADYGTVKNAIYRGGILATYPPEWGGWTEYIPTGLGYTNYSWWALIANWNLYGIDMWAGYNGTSAGMFDVDFYNDFISTHDVNGGAFRVGATIPLPVGALTGDFWFGNNKWYNPFILNTMDSTDYKDYYNVYYTLPVANNATLTLNYDYWKGKKPYNTINFPDGPPFFYFTFNPDQVDKDQRYYIQMDVKF
jgi:hypothetical protein